ncbi:MAG TPA: hybrid sensor histidine kinase/response regulator [Cyanothece sp. UBA12306]|nr:hybrid sensor histidine kinase/response regulator [Cyanothece sp. UBA12306]
METLNSSQWDILIVDDIPENLQLLFTILTEQGYEVRRVLNGKQALNVVRTEPPDLILLDVKMPELDGYQVCQQLKAEQKTRDIPVIFLSALNDSFDKVKAFKVGGIDYISKPFQLEEVIIRVESQLDLLKMHREIEQKNAELVSLNQDLNAFSYRISHDLKNHINLINNYTYLLIEKYAKQLDQKGKQYLNTIEEEGLRMQEIIEDLLRLAESQYIQITFDPINLSLIAQEIITKLQEQNPQQKREFIVTPDVYSLGDPGLIKIALENLLENAYKYTAKTPEPRIEFGKVEKNKQDVYFVRDNGVGFDPEKADQLFTPFHRLHSEEEFTGTGIGLATVHRIIQRHGGQIWYEAAVNQGATFYFTLTDARESKGFF